MEKLPQGKNGEQKRKNKIPIMALLLVGSHLSELSLG